MPYVNQKESQTNYIKKKTNQALSLFIYLENPSCLIGKGKPSG